MKRTNVVGLFVAIVVAIVAISVISWLAIKPVPNIIQGEVEAKSIKMSSKLAGRIESMNVQSGQKVKQGDLLYSISYPEAQAKLMQAEAARTAASAQSQKARTGARPEEISALYNVWQTSRAGLELAQKNYDRAKNLYESGVIPKQRFDEADANLKASQSTSAAAYSQYQLAVDGARSEDKKSADALVLQASGAVSEVESYITDAIQYAPVDAEVSTVIAEEGELIGAGYPVITLLDMNDVWVTFNIKENMLPKIKQGTVVKGYVPGLDRTVSLEVYYIAVQADYATWSATRTKGEFDIRTFEVRMRPEGNYDGLRPGMTVAVNWDEI